MGPDGPEGPDVMGIGAVRAGVQPVRRARDAFLAATLAVLALAAFNANAAGKPHPTYPERQEVPASDAEREAKCNELRARTAQLRARLGERGLLSRLNFVLVYQRSSERYLDEQCGDVDADGNALSHVAVRSGKIKGSPAPVSHGGEHAGEAHGSAEASAETEGAGTSGAAADMGHAPDANPLEPSADTHSGLGDADG